MLSIMAGLKVVTLSSSTVSGRPKGNDSHILANQNKANNGERVTEQQISTF
jgi:hypothetical protein